jgi:hypothetical protein
MISLPFRSSIPKGLRVEVLQGKTAILEQSSLLEELAERCGQSGAMHWLEHFFTVPTFRGRTPYLLLGVGAETGKERRASNVYWAVMMYEFSVFGFGLRIFSTDDISGFRTVIAPVEERHLAVKAAAETLLQRGGQVMLISFVEERGNAGYGLETNVLCRWALRQRPVANTLLLNTTYDETLMSLGKATRFNMRYYRRRLERRMPCELVDDARELFSKRQIDAMNTESLNPFPRVLNQLQFESAKHMRGGFLLCLRTVSGEWLGIIGGWRQAGTTVLLWQMNRAGFEKDSLGTVVRSYFVEHEIQRGAEKVMFYGGTTNSIQNSFVQSKVADLVVVRSSIWARILRGIASLFAKPRWWVRNPNFLARALCTDPMVWHESGGIGKQLK